MSLHSLRRALPACCAWAIVLGAVLVAGGCGDGGDDQVAGPRQQVLTELGDTVILPTYRRFLGRTLELEQAAETLWQTPNPATLAQARQAWRRARQPWKQGEAFRFGPTEDLQLRIRTKVDWSPIRGDRIEAVIAADDPLTPEFIDTLGTNRRGFLALEYLWFDATLSEDAILQRLTGSDGERRRRLAWAIAGDLVVQAGKLVAAWEPSGNDYLGEFSRAGFGSLSYPRVSDAVDELVGAVVLLASTVEENKLGRPFGLKSDGEPRPESVEAPASGNSLADIADNLQSIANVYLGSYDGAEGMGLTTLVQRVSPAVDAEIRETLLQARLALRPITLPLEQAVFDEREAVAVALARATDLRIVLSLDMVSALGATPRFIGDGD